MTTTERKTITIYRDGIWAGQGWIDSRSGEVVDCAAVLGADQDASDETYEAIDEAIESGDESVSRPDGVYTWDISE